MTATSLDTVLSSQLGATVSQEILRLLSSGQSAQSPDATVNIVTDYTGGSVPLGTDLVYVNSTAVPKVGDELSNVPAIIVTGTGSSTILLHDGVDHVIALGGGSDVIQLSGATNDVIANVGAASAVIDTGAGFDKVVLAGSMSDYSSVVTDTGLSLVNKAGSSILISNAEYVQFADGSVIINAPTTSDATIAKLYDVALGRTADSGGINYWWDTGNATSSVDIANTFLHSQEFANLHGNVDSLSTGEFLDILYTNAFGRSADAAGKAYWQSVLDGGGSKAQIVLYFAQSKEAADLTASKINVIKDILI